VQEDLRALVLVLEVSPPGPNVRHWIPGIENRCAIVAGIQRRVVEEHDDDVELISVADIVEAIGEDVALPDGVHWSPEGHRQVAMKVVSEIQRWIARHPEFSFSFQGST
jgi:hypothetical protein